MSESWSTKGSSTTNTGCRCSEPIEVEHMVAAGLRGLAGGRLVDLKHIVGCGRSAIYDCFDDFIDAVNDAPELDINFPQTLEGWQRVNNGFRRKSSNQILHGCVGALDGFFQRSNRPTVLEAANTLSYYSGHYESYGVNCQACVKSDLQFLYFGVISPGSTNDNVSYNLAEGLRELFENLPLGLYGVADAAYTLSESILIPFTGADRQDKAHDAFNYYLSQLQIRVEIAFGRMVNKFRILSGKIEGSIDRVSAILTACARLHNFIIQQDGPFDVSTNDNMALDRDTDDLEIHANPRAPLGMSYLPTIPDESFLAYQGISQTRVAHVDHLRSQDIGRPLHNIVRKRRELAVVVSANGCLIDREYVSPL